jgi:uncharacterized protein YdcH (DUF465 family)
MFENDKELVNQLLDNDDGFRRLYEKHTVLNARVDEITSGDEPMTQLKLETLKKEKLHLADQLRSMIQHHQIRA